MNLKQCISDRISERRRAAGFTQKFVAERLGLKNSTVSNWEQGRNAMDIDTLVRLCSILNCALSDIVGYDSLLSSDDSRILKVFHLLNTTNKRKVINFAVDLLLSPEK